MFKYLDRLRQKPDSYKKKFSISVSFSIVCIIFIVWLSVIYPDVINIGKKKSDIRKGPSPTNAFFANIHEGFSALGESFDGLNESITNLTKSVEDSYYASSTTGGILEENNSLSSSTSSGTLEFSQENVFGTSTSNEFSDENSN